METLLLILAPIVLIAVVGVVSFNRLARMRQFTRNAWSDVDVFLKRRAELVPNLVEVVRAYAKHEEETFTKTIQARNNASSAPSVKARAQEETIVSQGVTRTLMLSEAYPELKANGGFLDLQKQLSETEKLIANARQYYNACVRDYNTLIESFPSNLVAGPANFKPADFFEIEQASDRVAPAVQGLG